MHIMNLSSNQLHIWLAQKGLELQKDFFKDINRECRKKVISERILVINDVPWRGAMKMVFAFIHSSKLINAGWLLPSTEQQDVNKLFIPAVIFIAITTNSCRIHRPTKWFTPYVETPEYRIKIEYPTLSELDNAWNSLSAIAPKICSISESLSHEFETQLTRFSYSKN